MKRAMYHLCTALCFLLPDNPRVSHPFIGSVIVAYCRNFAWESPEVSGGMEEEQDFSFPFPFSIHGHRRRQKQRERKQVKQADNVQAQEA
jgi:hypothetical protein